VLQKKREGDDLAKWKKEAGFMRNFFGARPELGGGREAPVAFPAGDKSYVNK
jgi:hypothetical protein